MKSGEKWPNLFENVKKLIQPVKKISSDLLHQFCSIHVGKFVGNSCHSHAPELFPASPMTEVSMSLQHVARLMLLVSQQDWYYVHKLGNYQIEIVGIPFSQIS